MLLFYVEKVSLCSALMGMSFCADPVAWSVAGRRLCDGPMWTDIKILCHSCPTVLFASILLKSAWGVVPIETCARRQSEAE